MFVHYAKAVEPGYNGRTGSGRALHGVSRMGEYQLSNYPLSGGVTPRLATHTFQLSQIGSKRRAIWFKGICGFNKRKQGNAFSEIDPIEY